MASLIMNRRTYLLRAVMFVLMMHPPPPPTEHNGPYAFISTPSVQLFFFSLLRVRLQSPEGACLIFRWPFFVCCL